MRDVGFLLPSNDTRASNEAAGTRLGSDWLGIAPRAQLLKNHVWLLQLFGDKAPPAMCDCSAVELSIISVGVWAVANPSTPGTEKPVQVHKSFVGLKTMRS